MISVRKEEKRSPGLRPLSMSVYESAFPRSIMYWTEVLRVAFPHSYSTNK